MDSASERALLDLFAMRAGHFVFESGHHGDRWLDLELLMLRPNRVQPYALLLAGRLRPLAPEMVCGPLIEGAFVGQLVAAALDVDFCYTEPRREVANTGLFPVGYRLPPALRRQTSGRRVVVVNDVINAGSAVRGTLAELDRYAAHIVGIGSLLVLGPAADRLAGDHGVPLEALSRLNHALWLPGACPLCKEGVPLTDRTDLPA